MQKLNTEAQETPFESKCACEVSNQYVVPLSSWLSLVKKSYTHLHEVIHPSSFATIKRVDLLFIFNMCLSL